MTNGGGIIYGPGGDTVLGNKGLIVVKVPIGRPPPMQLLEQIGKVTNSMVVVVPSNMDIYSGKIAQEHLDDLHHLIHVALWIPDE